MCDIMSMERSAFLDQMNQIVAKNIKRLREERKLSMDELSKLSGVSKSMLAQIERGGGNPTISTLWKISNGMKVPFDALTVRPKSPYELVKTSDLQPLLEDGGKVKNYSIFPDDENRRFAVYYLELEEGSYWESEPHLKGAAEFITIFSGKIEICTGGRSFQVEKGESIRFKADAVHSYKNIGAEPVLLHMIIYNP
ncbi:DNA-binding helix-turn-helix protein [[Clostridium] asparagiforme DSM 15981]|uniref:DNA-binding helix-turn-helix protein n=2 Tax=Lachnospiraceae TaxID=186803 RepID=C0D412_9FIRM|nr:XRE family transcriptional regulator [Enterocloster asparagiformis]EEG53924.1 DNA-binding helix-turn-helix protein [[Clostridium] asparagiforme DSM 15981]